jgi:hypothetical protein
MLGLSGQWPGATLFTNGLLLLDPHALLTARGWNVEELTTETCLMAVRKELAALRIEPSSRILLTNIDNN